jgi:hypothetical protein
MIAWVRRMAVDVPRSAWDAPMEPFRFEFESRSDETIGQSLGRFVRAVGTQALPVFRRALDRATSETMLPHVDA